MPSPTFKGDPYRVLDVDSDASDETIKRRWRELAREHHPDNAAHDLADAKRRTSRMARINAAYDLLRDPTRRAHYDATASPGRSEAAGAAHGSGRAGARGPRRGGGYGGEERSTNGPPPPPPSRPVTARFDTGQHFHRQNTVTSNGRPTLGGQRPRSAREAGGAGDGLRASEPTGPVYRRPGAASSRPPTLAEAHRTTLEFGRFRGHTLAEVADFEPTYIDWIARTITRDRDLVQRARVIQADLDARGIERQLKPPTPGFGRRREEEATA